MSGTTQDDRSTPSAPQHEAQHAGQHEGQRLPPPGSSSTSLGVRHPWWWIGTGLALGVVAAVVLAATASGTSPGGELALDGLALVAAVLVALPGLWSLRHPERARAIATQHELEREDFLAHHRVRAWAGTPLVGAAAALVRTPRFFSHPGPGQFGVTGLVGAAFGLLVVGGVALSVRVRRSRRDR